MNWKPTKLSEFLTERDGRIKYDSANQLGLQRIKKIDFSGNIHLDAETDTKTDMIRVKSGDLVISGINAAKGAIAVHAEDDDVLATIHYSAYEFNSDLISVDFLKWFFKSPEFSDLLREQIPGGIKTELKPKHILPLQVQLPKLSEQITVAERLNRFRLEHLKLEHELTHQQSLITKLKQAILQEAIQGKLTADWRAARPEVEPASHLLHRIQAEKARLIAAKKLRPDKPIIKILHNDIPFALPTGWTCCRLGSLFEIVRGSSPRPKGDPRYFSKTRTPYHWIKISDFTPFGVDGSLTDTAEFLTAEGIKHSRAVNPGDILIACSGVGSVGKSLQLSISGYIYDGLLAIREVIDPTIRSFLSLFIRFKEITIYSVASGANWLNINTDILSNYVVPLPPLAEQAAIVERVEALMTTCQALEAEIEHSRTHAAHLLQAVLKEAFSPSTTE